MAGRLGKDLALTTSRIKPDPHHGAKQEIGRLIVCMALTPSEDGAGANSIAVVNRMESGAKQVESA